MNNLLPFPSLHTLQAEALKNIPNGIMLINAKGIISWANPYFLELTGYSLEEITGKTPHIFDSGKHSHKHYKKLQKTVLSAHHWHDEVVIRDKNNSLHHQKVTISPIKSDQGEMPHYVAIMEDITEQKLQAEAYQSLIDHSLQGFAIYQNERIVFANPETKNIIGYKPDELYAMSREGLLELIPKEDLEIQIQALQDRFTGKEIPERSEARIIHKNGKIIHLAVFGRLISYQGTPANQIAFIDITERKAAEEQLRKLSLAVEAAPVSVVITNINGNIEYTNPFFSKITGYSPEEVLGTNPRLLQSGQTAQETYTDMWDTILSGQIWQGELINKKKDGTTYTESAQISPVLDAQGNITHLVGIKQDVSDRKMAEEKLKASEDRYRNLIERASDIVYRISSSGHVEYANPQVERLTGYSNTELAGKRFIDLVHPDWKDHIQAFYRKQRDKETFETSLEFPILTKEGKERWVEQTVNLSTTNGEVTGLQGIARDITERKTAEDKLKISEERYRRLAENAPDIVFRYRFYPELGLEYINPRVESITGYTPEDCYKDPLLMMNMAHPNDTHIMLEKMQNLEGTSEAFIMRWIGKDDITRWMESRITPVHGPGGQVIAIEGMTRDISENRKTENELRESKNRYDELTANIPVGVFRIRRFDTDKFGFTYFSSRASQMLGFEEKEVLSSPDINIFDHLVHPDDYDEPQKLDHRLR